MVSVCLFVCLFVCVYSCLYFFAGALKFTLTLSSGMPTLWRSWLYGLLRENTVRVCVLCGTVNMARKRGVLLAIAAVVSSI